MPYFIVKVAWLKDKATVKITAAISVGYKSRKLRQYQKKFF
jgi:hypothetical protein